MKRQWNFVLEGKLITVYEESYEAAEKLAHLILQELKESSKDE
jgi:hypothetical protein